MTGDKPAKPEKVEKPPLVATHEIFETDFSVTLHSGNEAKYKFSMIVDNNAHMKVEQQPLHRARTELDDRDMEKPEKPTPGCVGFAAQ